MKRYKVNLGLNISARNKREALNLVQQIVESGQAVTTDGRWLGIKIPNPTLKSVEELPF